MKVKKEEMEEHGQMHQAQVSQPDHNHEHQQVDEEQDLNQPDDQNQPPSKQQPVIQPGTVKQASYSDQHAKMK